MTGRAPSAPPGLVKSGRGRRFWRATVTEYDLRADELELLAEVCRSLDLLDRLRAAIGDDLVVGSRVNPLLVERRLVQVELRRMLAQLCLPDADEGGTEELPPRVAQFRSERARRAARARWADGGV